MENVQVVYLNKTEGYWCKVISNFREDKKRYQREAISRIMERGHSQDEAVLIFEEQQRRLKR